MKKNLMVMIALCLLMLYASWASGAPFLVCDPPAADEQIATYEIFMDGVLLAANIEPEADGSVKYDLDGVAPGQYTFTAKACNVWGCSDASNPIQSPPDAAAPAGLTMEAE